MDQPTPPLPVPEPPGRTWWTVTAVLHAVCAVMFAAGCWAAFHWIQRVSTDAYQAAHPDGADVMMMGAAVVFALAVGCAGGVVYAVVGFAVTRIGLTGGPVMLIIGVFGAAPAGVAAGAEVPVPTSVGGLLVLCAMALFPCGLAAGFAAVNKPRRRPRRPVPVVPAPYNGGSPYPRPPGR